MQNDIPPKIKFSCKKRFLTLFSILSKTYFMQFIPRSHSYRHTGVFTWLAGVNVWPTGVDQWPCQVGWLSLTTKNRNCRSFYLKTKPRGKVT